MSAAADTQAYATIVADPPWDYGADKRLRWTARGGNREIVEQPYGFLSVEEIAGLPVSTLADRNAHLYLWTTQRYLRSAYWIVEAWGFEPIKTLVWAKNPRGFNVGGTFQSATEFVLFGRRGELPAFRQVERDWFNWPRAGNRHSAKPEAFLDLVESVSPGPYLELFARRNRLGWDTWGDDALQHVDAASKVALVS